MGMVIHTLDFVVKWRKFTFGASFFIPCLDVETATRVVRAECKKRKYIIKILLAVEDSVRGIRVWRVRPLYFTYRRKGWWE